MKPKKQKLPKQKNPQGLLIHPCPKCGSYKVMMKDCNYSSFNPGWAACPCGYRYDVGYVDHHENVLKPWNAHCREIAADLALAESLVDDLANAAWKVLNHDNDPHDGKEWNTHNWTNVCSSIKEVLKKHGIKHSANNQ
jgi:hypothetical protein